MYICLGPEAIGVEADLPTVLRLAQRYQFPAVSINSGEVADLIDAQGVDAVRDMFAEAGIRPAVFGLPVNFRDDEALWEAGLAELPRLARAAQLVGCVRCATWIKPFSDTLDFAENFAFHVARLTPIARILADHGIRFGLEWVGPKTLRDPHRYPFIHTMAGMLELCQAIGTENMGLLVDCYHVYTSFGRNDEIRQLRNEQVVLVHVNDAPAGVPVDEQLDGVRDLPGATGVIDLVGFLHALRDIGYDGPVMAEPFSQQVREMGPEDAVAVISQAMHTMMQRAGLTS